MRPVTDISGRDNARIEHRGPFDVVRRDPVEPEPAGTIVLMAFRIVGYDRDCDGSLMGRFEHIDKNGEATGWEPSSVGVDAETGLVVAGDELRKLFES